MGIRPMSDSIHIYLIILLAGVLPNYIWRFFGVVFAARLDETSEILRWVNAVATTLIAALVTRMIIVPPGPLAETGLVIRILALITGVTIYWAGNRNLGLAVAAAVTALVTLNWLIPAYSVS